MASFGEAWKDFWSMKFTGRSTRAEYWKMVVFYQVVMALLFLLQSLGRLYCSGEYAIGVIAINSLMGLFSLLMSVPSIAQMVRRLHDSGHGGGWSLLMLLPIVGWIMLLPLLLLPSEKRRNDYGNCPIQNAYSSDKGDILFGFLCLSSFVMYVSAIVFINVNPLYYDMSGHVYPQYLKYTR